MKNWNRIYGGRANDALIAHLVRQIRTWRPDVLVIPAGRDGDGLNEITRQSVVTAVKLAGDPAYLGNQLLAAGCEPWNVQRVYLVTDSKSGGTIALTGDDWSPRLGQSWTDAALTARGLLERDYLAGPAAVSIQRIASNGSEATPRDLQRPLLTSANRPTSCPTSIQPAAAIRDGRRRTAPRSENVRLDGLAQRRQVETAFTALEQDPPAFLNRLTKGDGLPQGIDAGEAAILTFRIAERLYQSGRWDLADKAFSQLLDRYPDDSLARWAVVWRLHYAASGALRARIRSIRGARRMPRSLPGRLSCLCLIYSPRPRSAIRYPRFTVGRTKTPWPSGSMFWTIAAWIAMRGRIVPAVSDGLPTAKARRRDRSSLARP